MVDFKPFDFLSCPVCSREVFEELLPHGGVSCTTCNATFDCSPCGSDRGIVVNCRIDEVHSEHFQSLKNKGMLLAPEWPATTNQPRVYFYTVLKPCDMSETDPASGVRWILTSVALPGNLMLKDGKGNPIWQYMVPGILPQF